MPKISKTEGGWILDKKIGIGVLVTLFLQAVGLVIWGATLSANDRQQDLAIAELKTKADKQGEVVAGLDTRLAVINTNVATLLKNVDKLLDTKSASR